LSDIWILTTFDLSGTLSPLDDIITELGIPFDIRLATSHVIPPSSLSVYGVGKNLSLQKSLNCRFRNMKSPPFQDDIGESLLVLFRHIPDGILVFISSYQLLNDLILRWKNSGLLRQMSQIKNVHVETQTNQDLFLRGFSVCCLLNVIFYFRYRSRRLRSAIRKGKTETSSKSPSSKFIECIR